jgi:nucleolar protein 14
MRGEEDDSASDDAEGSDDGLSSRKRKKGKAGKSARRAEGDDLGDDFDFEGDEVRGFGLGGGLAVEDAAEDAEVEESDEGDLEDEVNSEDDDEEEEEGESDVGSEMDENEMLADLLHGDEASAEEDEAEALVKPARKGKGKQVATSRKELPFTFPCPATHEELLELLDGTDEQDLPVVIERIRTLYHPSLAEGNKQKLAVRIPK